MSTLRKPVTELSESDFDLFPCWEFALDEESVDGQDETWVRPMNCVCLPSDDYSIMAAADVRTSSGSRYFGIVTITTAESDDGMIGYETDKREPELQCLDYLVVHGPNAKAHLNTPGQTRKPEIAEFCDVLGTDLPSLFPLTVSLQSTVEGESNPRNFVVR